MTDFGQCGRARLLQWILTNVNKVKIPSTNHSVSFYQLNRADSRKRAHLHNWCVCNKASFCVMNKLCCRLWSNTCNLTKKWKSSSFVCDLKFNFIFSQNVRCVLIVLWDQLAWPTKWRTCVISKCWCNCQLWTLSYFYCPVYSIVTS